MLFQKCFVQMFGRAVLLLAAVLLVPFATAAENAGAKARLAHLEIEIWPEYDQSAALVILKGELAAGSDRAVTLRIPVASGGPIAVAQSSAAGSNLLNMPYDRSDGKDAITLRMQVPERFFHIEFYDPINIGSNKREYRYVWPGDLAADKISVHIQQPALSNDFAITPAFSESATGKDKLVYWSKDLGAAPAGKAVPIALRYTKSDARTSKKILEVTEPDTHAASEPSPGSAPAPAAPVIDVDAVKPADGVMRGSSESKDDWMSAAFLVFLAAMAAGVLWFNLRTTGPAVDKGGDKRFCTKCGNKLNRGDRFCSKCGTAVA